MGQPTDRLILRLLRLLAVVLLVVLLLPYLLAPLYRVVDPVSTRMLWRWVTGSRLVRTPVPLERMASSLPLAVIVAEDARFCTHHGVDWRELREAYDNADDLPMRRSPPTRLATSSCRSGRVVEIYLNVAEWGPNGEFGTEAARAQNRRATLLPGRPRCSPRSCRTRAGAARASRVPRCAGSPASTSRWARAITHKRYSKAAAGAIRLLHLSKRRLAARAARRSAGVVPQGSRARRSP